MTHMTTSHIILILTGEPQTIPFLTKQSLLRVLPQEEILEMCEGQAATKKLTSRASGVFLLLRQ